MSLEQNWFQINGKDGEKREKKLEVEKVVVAVFEQ
jgi:hypothetical protein